MKKSIATLSILGILVSLYLAYLKYNPTELDSSFCNITEYLSCSTVNTSSYSTFLGIPVAIIGAIGFLLLFLLSFEKIPHAQVALFYSSAIGLVFMLYLFVAELFIIKAICIFCIVVLLMIIAIFVLTAKSAGKESIAFLKSIRFE